MLTLARMWRTLLTGDFVPKDVAATWAAARLPQAEGDLLLAARQAYLDGRDVDWKAREQQLQRTLSALHDRILEKAGAAFTTFASTQTGKAHSILKEVNNLVLSSQSYRCESRSNIARQTQSSLSSPRDGGKETSP